MIGEGDYRIPDGVTQLVASNISWGGYANGQIPLDAMRYSPTSNYMHPSASAAWDQLHAAAAAEGYDLRGNGYRPASAGGATSGKSNHGWGLAIDIQVLVIDSTNPRAVDAAFASDEYTWLINNAPLYGFLNPAWAKPPALGGKRQRRPRRRPMLLPRTMALGMGRLHEHECDRWVSRRLSHQRVHRSSDRVGPPNHVNHDKRPDMGGPWLG